MVLGSSKVGGMFVRAEFQEPTESVSHLGAHTWTRICNDPIVIKYPVNVYISFVVINF